MRDVLQPGRRLSRPLPLDLPRWRQRTGYDFGYLPTREGDPAGILHRMLCAMWTGKPWPSMTRNPPGGSTSSSRVR